MPLYLFRSEDGTEREELYKAGEAPSLGEWTTLDGTRYQRVIEMPQLANSKGTPNFRLHSNALPDIKAVQFQEAQARKYGLPMPVKAKRYDEVGRPVFRSTQELAEHCKRDGRYSVGNPKEVCQEARRPMAEVRKTQLAEVAQREKQSKAPIVR